MSIIESGRVFGGDLTADSRRIEERFYNSLMKIGLYVFKNIEEGNTSEIIARRLQMQYPNTIICVVRNLEEAHFLLEQLGESCIVVISEEQL